MRRRTFSLPGVAAAIAMVVALGVFPGCGGGISAPASICGLWLFTIDEWPCPVPDGILDPGDNLDDETFDVVQSGQNVTINYTDRAGNDVTFSGSYGSGGELVGDLTVVTPGATRTLVLRLEGQGINADQICVDGSVRIISDTAGLCEGELVSFWAKILVPCNGVMPATIQCRVDFILLMDTSQSTELEALLLCPRLATLPGEVRDAVQAAADAFPLPPNVTLNVEVFTKTYGVREDGVSSIPEQNASIGVPPRPRDPGQTFDPAPTTAFSCITANVINELGASVPIFPGESVFPGEENLNAREDTASALAVIANRFPWRPDSTRLIIAMTDEGFENGGTGDICGTRAGDPDGDQEAVDNAIAWLTQPGEQPIIANFVLGEFDDGDGIEPCVAGFAAQIASATGGQVVNLASAGDLFDSIKQILVDQCVAELQLQLNDLPDDTESPTAGG